MQLINKNSDYAIRSILEIAVAGNELRTSKEISKKKSIPLQYVRRILGELGKAGLVESVEGKYGGFKLINNPKKITLKDIIELFQGEIKINKCMFRQELCPNRAKCVVRSRVKKIEKKLVEEFEKVTIKDLIDDLKVCGD